MNLMIIIINISYDLTKIIILILHLKMEIIQLKIWKPHSIKINESKNILNLDYEISLS